MDINIFKNTEECNRNLAKYLIEEYLLKNKNIAISGGSTPIGLFKSILKLIKIKSVIKSNFFWVDERCVSPISKESNYGEANRHFFSKLNIDKNKIYRIKGENDGEIEAIDYSKLLNSKVKTINNIISFDLCLLGIGGDGHTASIFPYELKKLINKNSCVVGTNPDSGQKRVSLSINQINNSKEIIIQACGEGKKIVVDNILSQKNNYLDYPASYIKPKSKKLSWYLDFDSAGNYMN
tara:strand:- start:1287 stop:1997 length:711 start_codon:yes stop_codon:yes gene_type:complete